MVEYRVMNYCQKSGSDNPFLYLCCRNKRGDFRLYHTWDEKLRPEFFVRDEHLDLFNQRLGDTAIAKDVFNVEKSSINTIFHETCTAVRTKFPGMISSLRNYFPATYQADITWDKMAFNKAGLSEYIDVNLSKSTLNFLPLDSIKPLEDVDWSVERRKLVFDIETHSPDTTGVPTYNDAVNGLVEVIIYAGIDSYTKKITVLRVGDNPLPVNVYKNPLPPKVKKQIGAMDEYEIEEHLFPSQKELLNYLVNDHIRTIRPDALMGHNIAGGNVLRPWGTREWKNGFDLPIIFGTCKHLKIDVSQFSPIGRAFIAERGNKLEVMIDGVLVADWLYWWKYSHIGDSLFKIDHNGKVVKLKNDRLGSIADISFDIRKLKPVDGVLDAKPEMMDLLSEATVGEQYKMAPHYTTMYCIHDAMLSYFLDLMYNIVDDLAAVPVIAGGKPDEAVYAQKYSDDYTLKVTGKKYRLPTKLYSEDKKKAGHDIYGKVLFDREWDDKMEKYGGYVPDICQGFHEGVVVMDFSRMYPRESQSINEGVDTRIFNPRLSLRKDGLWLVDFRKDNGIYDQTIPWEFKWEDVVVVPCVAEDKLRHKDYNWLVFYRKDFDSSEFVIYDKLDKERTIFQNKANQLLEERGKFDAGYIKYNGAQKSRKYMSNARIGVKGSPGERLGSERQFNSITCSCSWLTRHVQWYLEHVLGMKVLGGDTDSVFVQLHAKGDYTQPQVRKAAEEEMHWLEEEVNREIARFLKDEYRAPRMQMKMGVEKLCSAMYLFAKKRYVGKIAYNEGRWLDAPDYLYRGIELRKRNTSYFTDQAQFAFVDLLLQKGDKAERARKLLAALKHEFFVAPPSAVGEMTYLSKPLHKYNDIPRARAARTTDAVWRIKLNTDDDFYLVYILPQSAHYDKIPQKLKANGAVMAVTEEMETRFIEEGFVIDYDKHWSALLTSLEPFLKACGYVERLKGYNSKDDMLW